MAAVRTRLRIANVPREFTRHLDQVYAAARAGDVTLDGQNIFVYHGMTGDDTDVDFGVGTRASFAPTGNVQEALTPSGRAATTTHWGSYSGLRDAHVAVKQWCRANGEKLAGPHWEVYGHWTDDPTKLRTDVYWLLDT